jgi:hypothetical protein
MDSTTYALPATPKQIAYARSLALRNQTLLPWDVQQDRRSLSAWIEAQARLKPVSDMDRVPTSKQVAFAEKLARIKRRAVPDECFRDKELMSKWIDGNKYPPPPFSRQGLLPAWGETGKVGSSPEDQGLVPAGRREVPASTFGNHCKSPPSLNLASSDLPPLWATPSIL